MIRKDTVVTFLKRRKFSLLFIFSVVVYFTFCLPKVLFNDPCSTILYSKEGDLLNAHIAKDGQWRFPAHKSVPEKFSQALIAFEDRSFNRHLGVSFKALGRAFYQNIKAGKIVSGASTITMQVARLSRRNKRTYVEKLIELFWATRMELRYSKEEILALYASHAPFGGNVVGLEAASWRYFGLPPEELSWAAATTLAVLPNAPGLIYPGKNHGTLMKKRNAVLKYLFEHGTIDQLTYELAIEEPLPNKPNKLPSFAPHLLVQLLKQGHEGKSISTTITKKNQQEFTQLLNDYQQNLSSNYIHNSALLVIDTELNEVVAYVGNGATDNNYQQHVDIIQSPRSTGSILKPFLYAVMLQEGQLHGDMLLPDIPLRFSDFAPKNFVNQYDGAVRAKHALARSLNVPAVYLLSKYGADKFLHVLQKLKFKHINRSAEDYGLSLILGGAEASLWDICKTYVGMAKTLRHYTQTNQYNATTWEFPKLITTEPQKSDENTSYSTFFDAASIYLMFNALTEVNRPGDEANWKHFSSTQKIAWKTGTSFGNRDAWSVGYNGKYVVGVWVGNATGEGRPNLVGAYAAAPIMFDVFSRLKPSEKWIEKPHEELINLTICVESGFRNSQACTKLDTIQAHFNAINTPSCNFHKRILTDSLHNYQYFINCAPKQATELVDWFVLPPIQAWYYQQRNPSYKNMPPFHPQCVSMEQETKFALIYPENRSVLVQTKDMTGVENGFVFEAKHTRDDATLFWHLNATFLGTSETIHKLNAIVPPGKHTLTVVDNNGDQVRVAFEVKSQ